MATETPHFLELDADPADNPNQPPADQQGEHKTGTKRQVEEIRKLLKAPEPSAEALQAHAAMLAQGDVVFDYSSAKPTDAQLRAAKAVGVCRYLSPLNADGSDYGPTLVKVIQIDELKWHIANGRYVRLNYEWYEGRMADGAGAGTQDAYWAGTKAWKLHQAAGINPATTWWAKWIVHSDDTGATPYAAVKAHMLALYAQYQKMPGKYLPDYYGRQAIYKALLDDPDIHWIVPGWQTCAWSGGVYGGFADPNHAAALYQALCVPVTPNIAGCDTNFVMQPQKFGAAETVVGGDSMIVVQAPNGGLGLLGQYGIYHLNGEEWAGVKAIRDALPAAIRDTVMPWVKITDAQWTGAAPDGMQRMMTMLYRGDTLPNGQAKPPGQNTHPANIEFIYAGVAATQKATDTVESSLTTITTTQTELKGALALLPKEFPPLSDAQIAQLADALSQIHPPQSELMVRLEGTAGPTAPTPPTP